MSMTAQQRAEYRDAIARTKIAAEKDQRARKEAEARASQSRREYNAKKVVPIERMTLKLSDLSTEELIVFDRLWLACDTEFATVDVTTHLALVARKVVEARMKAMAA